MELGCIFLQVCYRYQDCGFIEILAFFHFRQYLASLVWKRSLAVLIFGIFVAAHDQFFMFQAFQKCILRFPHIFHTLQKHFILPYFRHFQLKLRFSVSIIYFLPLSTYQYQYFPYSNTQKQWSTILLLPQKIKQITTSLTTLSPFLNCFSKPKKTVVQMIEQFIVIIPKPVALYMQKTYNRPKGPKNNRAKHHKPLRKQTEQTQQDLQGDLLKKFTSFMSKQHLQFLKARLYEYYGKNFAIEYRKNYGFDEDWQGFLQNEEQIQKFTVFQNQNNIYTGLLFCIMCVNSTVIWMSSIQTFFMGEAEGNGFRDPALYAIAMVLELAYMVVRVALKKRRTEEKVTIWRGAKESYKNLLLFCYFLVKITTFGRSIWWYIVESLCVYLMYRRASNIYSSLKLMNIALVYEYQFKIMDIILNLVIIAHFISIGLHEVTKLGFEQTWVSVAGLNDKSPLIRYVYSFYFCCTTILTVGYGDISPRNYAEVIVVTLVEIFGIISFAYFINEIGYSLSAMRKTNESIEKDLMVIQKIKKWYQLDEELAKRARSHIINNKTTDSQLSPQEEKSVMLKLSEDLRMEIKSQNALKIVKSSVFFLLRWSISFQNAISLRLSSIIFPPGQILYQPVGKERIYIIRQGKIDIYASKRGAKRGSNATILKSIENQLNTEVSNNAYGFTAVISRRPVKLYAVAKRPTCGYYIQKEKFYECIRERQTDYEFYHEFKNRVDESPCWQSFEVPRLNSSKHHYNPTRTYIFRRHNRQKTRQRRHQFLRNCERKAGLRVDESIQNYDRLKRIASTLEANSTQIPTSKKTIQEILQERSDFSTTDRFNIDFLRNFSHFFESSKEYTNYFPHNNRSMVLKCFDIEMGVTKVEKEEACAQSTFYDALKEYREVVSDVTYG